MQAEDGNSADGGDGAGNIGGGDGAGRLRSTVPVLYTKSSVPYENFMGFYRERTKSAYLCVMVWMGEGQSVSGVVGAAD